MRSAIVALLLILPSSQALASLCAGQSPEQKVIFEDRFADNAAQWFLNDRDDMKPNVSNGAMTIETLSAWVVPKGQMADSGSHGLLQVPIRSMCRRLASLLTPPFRLTAYGSRTSEPSTSAER